VARARAGENAALAELYRTYRPLVRGVLLARLSPADADDVAQEVFVTAFARISSLRDDSAVASWLCTIARTKAIDLMRTRKPTDAIDDIASTSTSPDDLVEAKRVLAVIQSLPEAYRESLVLRLVEGMSGPEIATLTGLTEGSVRVNLHRGMALLREKLR
jgi:RNA polymerase sigma-70 factor (ECF subfamily)